MTPQQVKEMIIEDVFIRGIELEDYSSAFDSVSEKLSALINKSEQMKIMSKAVDEGDAHILVENACDTIDGSLLFSDLDDAIEAIQSAKNKT